MCKVSHRESSTVIELGAWCHHGPSKLALISNLSRILNPSPGSFLRNTCWQAGDVEVEAEDLDEALADARALRTSGQWNAAALLKVPGLLCLNGRRAHNATICIKLYQYVTILVCHHPSEVSEEKQRKKKRSKDRKNQVPGHVNLLYLLAPSLLQPWEHHLDPHLALDCLWQSQHMARLS
jgi:hypothetical protein